MRSIGLYIASIGLAVLPFGAICSDELPQPVNVVAKGATIQHEGARALAAELARACPPAAKNDLKARDEAAVRLKESSVFERFSAPKVTWGQHKGVSYNPAKNNTTELSSLVWRTLYLSLYTFSGEHEIVTEDSYTVLRMKAEFRNDLGDGAYPYPFWHKPAKWDAYQKAVYVDFVFEKGSMIGAYRGKEMDASRPVTKRTFDGHWEWQDNSGKAQPFAALYDYLLSPNNPHKADLDASYRAFAMEARKTSCMECHSPDNTSNMEKLSILNLPGQALTHRHDIISELEQNAMPPKNKEHAAGIPDKAQRETMLKLAKAFAENGDKALKFETEKRAAVLPTEEAAAIKP